MRKGFLPSVAALLAGSGLALAQAPAPQNPAAARTEPPLFSAAPALAPASPGQKDKAVDPKAELIARPTPSDKPAPAATSSDKPLPDCCPDLCKPLCEVCGPPGRFWVSAEYLLWWIKTAQTPPLVTTSPDSSLGILGQPGTRVLIGGQGLDRDPLHGGRFMAGMWLDCCQTHGIEIGYFFLSNRESEASAGGPGTPGSATVARPFYNVLTGREDSQLVAFPNVLAGTATVTGTSRLQGITPNLICNLCCCSPKDCCDPRGYRVDLLLGPRYYDLEEDLSVREDLRVAPGVPVLGGSRINILDNFDTRNRFYGGFIGARAECWRGRMFANVTGGVALGSTNQIVEINGNTVITPPAGAVVNRAGGLLTQQTNIGRYSRNEFTYIPELGFNVGYQVTDHLRAYVGYSLLYWSDVVRPGDQIDRGINTTQLPTLGGQGTLTGPRRPAFSFQDSDFWAQGINFGVQLRF